MTAGQKARSLAALVMTASEALVLTTGGALALTAGVALVMTAVASAPLAAQGGSQLPAIPEGQLTAVAKSIKTLSVQPQTITLKVGQKVDLNTLVVVAIDSAGKPRGRLAGFDFANLPPGAPASVVPRVVTGVHPGTTELAIRFPRNFWKRPDPRAETKVKIVVTK
jgi:hypothetical protein